MASPRTTICCSAVALTIAASLLAQATPEVPNRPQPFPTAADRKSKPDTGPRPFFPVVPLWTLALNAAVTAAPGYDERSMYLPIEGDRLVAYDLASTSLRWIAPLGTALSPSAGDGLVFVIEPRAVVAARASDGSIAWQLPFAERSTVPPVWNNGWLFIATTDGVLLAYRASDGELLWRQDVGSPPHARPADSGDRVYVPTEDGRIIALQVDDGARVWERRLGGAANDILALEEHLYVGSKDNYFYCLSTRSGENEWRWRTGADAIGLPAIDEETVYFVSLDNVLRALRRSNGVQRWQRPLPLRPTVGPLKIGDTLVVAGLAPVLRGYSAKTGAPAGELPAAGELASAPRLFDDPALNRPELIIVTRDIAKGAAVAALATDLEPRMIPLAVLPNVVIVPPTLPKEAATP